MEAIAEIVDPWWHPFVLVLAYCGLRPGEAVALRRRDLDDLGRLTVERGISEHRGRLIEQDTKTHRARVVQVPASVLSELRDHLKANVPSDPESPVFTTPARTRVRMSNWRHKIWEPAALELDLPSWATPYVLRHTAASLMAQQGVPVSAAAAALGQAVGAKHCASNVKVLGSVAHGEDTPDSDSDILVDLSPRSSLITLGRLERELSDILGVPFDVVRAEGLREAVRAEAREGSDPAVSRHDREWLADIVDSIRAVREYQERGDLSDSMIFDAVRLRLIEIGEAVKRLSPALLEYEPDLPWEEIAVA